MSKKNVPLPRRSLLVLGGIAVVVALVVIIQGKPGTIAEGARKPGPTPTPTPVAIEGVRFISSQDCSGAKCHTLGITCEGIPERQVVVKEREVATPKGAGVFTTGGVGTQYYGNNATTAETLTTIRNGGYETFEVAWSGTDGWGTGAEGAGYKKAMCGYEKVVRWIAANKANNKQVMCAHGNSGGGFQIGYGLSVYGLEDQVDMAILTGGPPVSRVDVGCFGSADPTLQAAAWPAGIGGRLLTDKLMGWFGNGDYCQNGAGPQEAVQAAQDTSLVSPTPTETRDYDFPATKVNFVNSQADATAADEQGLLYFNALLSPKTWYEISGTSHEVAATTEGSQKIRELFLNECHTWP